MALLNRRQRDHDAGNPQVSSDRIRTPLAATIRLSRRYPCRIVALPAVVLLGLTGTASAAVSAEAAPGDDYGQHVVHCAQHHGFAGDHNPGMHQGRAGWSPDHVC